MNAPRFDTLVQRLSTSSSRRTALGALLGGSAALLTGAAALDAKKGGKGKGKAKGHGKGKGKGKGKGQPKVTFCHRTGKDDKFTLISVGGPAAKAHRKHGDTECVAGTCQTGEATGCNSDGTCTFANATQGTPCLIEAEAGVCDAGVCVAVP